jgi:hypothetical protein
MAFKRKRKAVKMIAHLQRVKNQLVYPSERTRAGRVVITYRKGCRAQTVLPRSSKDEIYRYLYPDRVRGTRVQHINQDQRKWLLTTLIEAYWTEGLRCGPGPKAIDLLYDAHVVVEPWAAKYKGTGLYKGQVGSEEKAQERVWQGVLKVGAAKRAKAIETRENNLDGGAAAPGLSHRASGNRQKTRGSDRVAREKKVAPPKARDEAAFRRKHRPEAEGCCDDCERPLAPSIYSPGQRRPVEREHQKGGRHAGRLRACLTVDVGCNQATRAEIDAYNDMLERAGEDPMTAEESAMLCKIQLARLGRLPPDDPHAGEIMRFLKQSERVAANARWPALDDPQTVASTTRSDRDFGEGREEAIAERRERAKREEASRPPKARAARLAKQRKEAATKKAKREAGIARRKATREAAKGAPPAFRRFALPPAPAPRGPRKRVAVEPYDPAAPSQYEISNRSWREEKARAAKAASKPAKRAAPPSAKPAKRRRR